MLMRRLLKVFSAVLVMVVITVALVAGLTAPASAAPEAPDVPTHSAITAPAYDVCSWTGVRDGYLIPGSDKSRLVSWRRFWYVDHYWVECIVVILVGTASCVKWIVSTHDGFTSHLGTTPCPH